MHRRSNSLFVDSALEKNNMSIFPNPTRGILHFESDADYQNLELSLYNLVGEKVYSVRNEPSIDLSLFSARGDGQ
jgi:hypothetical protein